MRIESLTLERYGAFTDRQLRFRPDAALHVVLGANEAGKTSALSAITDLFFGFGHMTPYNFLHEANALRVGGVLRLADGSALAVRRRKGTKNTLLDAADQPLADDLLAPVLGSVTRETFRSEFGLTAEALRSGGLELLKAGGRLAETLAASSAGLTALTRLREKLGSEADALFTARRSAGKAFYVAADRHDEAERRLRDAIVTADALAAADAAVAAAEARLADRTAEHEATGRALARLQRATRTRPTLARIDGLVGAIAGLSDLPAIAVQTAAEWRAALTRDAGHADELARLAAADAADAAAIDALGVDEALLAAGSTVDALRERIGAVRKAMEDRPRRLEAQRAAASQLDDAARRLGVASREALLAALPTDPAMARARDLIASGKRIEERRREATERRDQAVLERDRIIAAAKEPAEAADPEPFRIRLDALADVPATADRLRRDRAQCDAEERSIAEAAAALDPAVADPDALAVLPLPDEITMAAHARLIERAAADLRDGEARLAAAERAIAEAVDEIARLSRAGVTATRADLLAARTQRDDALDAARQAIHAGAADSSARLDAIRALVRAIDDITDQLLADTERATRRQLAEDRARDGRTERDRAVAAIEALTRDRDEAEAAWAALWAASGIAPRSPAEMMAWRERVSGLLGQRRRLVEKRAELAVLAASLEAHRGALVNLFEASRWPFDRHLPAELLYREAKARLDGMTRIWAEARTQLAGRDRAMRDAAEAEAALGRAGREAEVHAAAWPQAMAAIGLSPAASIAEAEAALMIWQGVGAPKQSFEREARSVEGIERDLAAFDRDVAGLVGAVAPDLAGRDAQAALATLVARLGEARRAADLRAGLREAGRERGTRRSAILAEREAIRPTLAIACGALGVDLDALGPCLDRLEKRQALEAERAGLERDLIDIADGLDAAALRREQAELDADLVPGEIARLQMRHGEILSEITAASAALHQARRERDDLAKGRDAASAARERVEAAAELLSIAERWVVRAAASRLASLAIEHHRAAVQDPLIARAGALFKLVTAGAFAGLGADYDDADRPVLVTIRADGARVPVAGLSEGTRDQLFLTLRLALLERRSAEPLPFIGDDLLASFDEERTARTLELLAAFGKARQVVLFTHHRHVAELAGALPGQAADILEL